MNITNETLKQIIKEELEAVLNENQVGLGLPHNFTGFDLAKRMFEAVKNEEDPETLASLRGMALERIRKIRFEISNIPPRLGKDENKEQEVFFLEHALDNLDAYNEDYNMEVWVYPHEGEEYRSRLGVPSEGPFKNRPLNRRWSKDHRVGKSDFHKSTGGQWSSSMRRPNTFPKR